jgi:hypothetical protein
MQVTNNDVGSSSKNKARVVQQTKPMKTESVPQQPIRRKSTPEQREIQNKVIRQADRGKMESDPTQGWGSKLNMDIKYNGLPENYKSNRVDIGTDNPVASDAYLYFKKQTEGKSSPKFVDSFKKAMQKPMEKAGEIYRNIDNKFTVGKYNENDDEYYLDGKKLQYTYPVAPSQDWMNFIKRVRKK